MGWGGVGWGGIPYGYISILDIGYWIYILSYRGQVISTGTFFLKFRHASFFKHILLFPLLFFLRISSIFEKAEKMRAEIIRKIAAEFLRELCSGPDW